MDLLDRLLSHDAWTTRQLLIRCRELNEGALHESVDAGQGSVHATLVHMIGNVEAWTALMAGEPVDEEDVSREGFLLDDLLARHDAAAAHFAAVARRVRMHHRAELLHMLARLSVQDLPEGDVLSWEKAGLSAKRGPPPRRSSVVEGPSDRWKRSFGERESGTAVSRRNQ